MEKEFIPYKQALALKELGFDEPCLAWYHPNEGFYLRVEGENINSKLIKKSCTAPLYQQVFRWLLKEHSLYAVIIPTITMCWTFKTMTVIEEMVEVPPYNHVEATDYGTYEEAELECLKKLIEIVKLNKL